MNTKSFKSFGLLGLGLALGACGSGKTQSAPPSFTIGGSVTGISGTVVLQNNGADNLTLSADGDFTFSKKTLTYSITVFAQPAGQTCTVTHGTGKAVAAITDAVVTCVTPITPVFTIGGSISGLDGEVVLQNNDADNLTVSENGSFTFLTHTAAYDVTVLTQPDGQTCTVTNANGTASADVSTVAINCVTDTYAIGGDISGVDGTVVLQNNGADNLPLSADGTFTFATHTVAYHVTVLTQPSGQTCTVAAGWSVATDDVDTVLVTCVDNPPGTFTIGGSITGVAGTVVLRNNGADDLSLSTDGTFNFATPTADYNVTIAAKSAELTCDLTNEQGTATALVDTVELDCRAARYFRATDGVNGYEMWVTDGTDTGTKMLKDINPTGNSNPAFFTLFNNTVYFSAYDGINGAELWKSDGTTAGTVMMKDINTTAGQSGGPGNFMLFNGVLYFEANDGTNGYELWKTDGTAVGTVLVTDINTTAAGAGSFPNGFVVYNGALYFEASDGVTGNELWKTDGTAVGTVLVKDINTTSAGASSTPIGMTVYNGELYFRGNDGINGYELWKTNGTDAGTVMVKDINTTAPGESSYTYDFIVLNDTLYFSCTEGVNGFELWKTDGTDAGTMLVKDINTTAGVGSDPGSIIVYNNAIYLSANDGVNGAELWKSDGTGVGTVMVKDLNPTAGVTSNPSNFRVLNGLLQFTATEGVNGDELWQTDGTDVGTELVKDICPDACNGIEP